MPRSLVSDQLRNFKFLVNLSRPGNYNNGAPRSVASLGFASVDGLAVNIQNIEYREGGMNTALPLDAPILTVNGWKAMGDVQVGDRVIDPKGQDSKVTGVFPAGVKSVYEVTLQDGSKAISCHGHLWEIEARDTNNNWTTQVMSTLEMKQWIARTGYRALLPKMTSFQYDVSPELPIDPYLLGVLLAEGSLEPDGVSFAQTEENAEVIERVRAALPEGHTLRTRSDGLSHAITVGNDGPGARNVPGRNKVQQALRDLGLYAHRSWEKFIPEMYKRASVEDRVALVQGVMDGDGWITENGSINYCSTSKQLAKDMQEMFLSLGGRCSVHLSTDRTYIYKGERRSARDTYTISGVGGLEHNPFFLSRKAERFGTGHPTKGDSYHRKVVSVEYLGEEEVQCIEVSADSHLYVAYDFMPTHNTSRKLPGQAAFGPLTLSRGVTLGRVQTWNWILELFSAIQGAGTGTVSNADPSGFRCDADIYVLQHPITAGARAGSPTSVSTAYKVKYKVYNCWPSGMLYSTLDAGGNAVFMEQMVLQHEGFEVTHAGDGLTDYVS